MDILIIAHFITEFNKNGTSRFVCIAEELSKNHNVELVTSTFDHIKKTQRACDNIQLNAKITFLKEPSYKKNISLKRIFSHYRFGTHLKSYLKTRKKPDVIYCAVPSLECASYAAKYAKKNKVRFIIDVQDLWPEAFKLVFNVPLISNVLFLPMKHKADKIYSNADTIVGVSNTYCERASRSNKKNARAIPVFLGTYLSIFDKYAIENKIERNSDKFALCYVGTIGYSYDIKCILDALMILRKDGYNKVTFWIIGDGPQKASIEEYVKANDLDVVFFGRVEYKKMCGLLCSCDACVNPLKKDAPQSIINKHGDYSASGLPIINTQPCLEYRSLIDKYKCGINCECSNPSDVATAIKSLIENKEERIEMGKRARVLARDMFDRTSTYTEIYKLFE